MTMISIDHAKSMGVAIFKDNKYSNSFVINLSSIENLKEAYTILDSIFKLHYPTVVVLEKVNVLGSKFGGMNVIKLSQLQGTIKLLAQMYNAKVFEINPTSMKKSLTGYGKAEKRQVAEVVAKTWNLSIDEICKPVYYKKKEGIKTYIADESDSIALGTYYLKYVDVSK